MPATFVASRALGSLRGYELDLVNSRTGGIERNLAAVSYGSAFVSSSTDVYFTAGAVGSANIYAVPLSGGTPQLLARGADPVALALSPDGTHLAWWTGIAGPLGFDLKHGGLSILPGDRASVSVTEMNLSTKLLRSWTVQMPTGRGDDVAYSYAVNAIGWLSNDQIALTSGTGFSYNCPNGECPALPPASQLPYPHLTLLSITAPATRPQTLNVPIREGFECRIGGFDAHGLLASTGGANELLAYAVRAGGTNGSPCPPAVIQFGSSPGMVGAGVNLVLLNVSQSQVTATTIGVLPAGVVPTSFDNSGKDLLATGVLTSGANYGASFIARVVAGEHFVYLDKGSPLDFLHGQTWDGAAW